MEFELIKNEFYEKGWCKVSNFFDQSFINLIKKELDDFIAINNNNYKTGEIHFTDKSNNSAPAINTIHVLSYKSKFFKDLLLNEKVINLMEFILDDVAEPQWSQLFAKPAKVGLASPMHQDNYYWNVEGNKTVTLWMAIDKVFEDNSGVSYYENSHNLGVVRHEASFAKGTSQKVADDIINDLPKSSLVTPHMEPGDILLHHSCTIHGSKDNLSDYDRRGMSMWYKAKSAGINKKNLIKYENSLKEQLNNLNLEK